jgi:poly-gamma-glutamate synthesis protein (capsule biosynthesis protein)
MEMIKKSGMKYFGGGVDAREALTPLEIDVKGTKFIFLGFNQPGPEYAFAKKNYPGAARFENKIFEELAAVWSQKGVLIFTLQSTNEDDPVPAKSQTRIFRKAVDLGAVIALSSSAHRAMGVEIYKGRLIMYGLGNFLFDQMQTINHRRGMIARHRFYEGRHVDTELIPYIMHNNCRPVIARGKDAAQLFDYVFSHSTGPVFKKIYR